MTSEISVQQQIKNDKFATDLLWSVFVAALQSYKFDSLLKPFPPPFTKEDGEKDIKSLEKTVDEIPALKTLSSNGLCIKDNALSLLQWVLDRCSFSIKTLKASHFEEIKKQIGDTVPVTDPDYVFEVIPSEADNARFEETRRGRKTMFAYHGSRLENFHSILHNGLVSHMNKISVFGEGTYLSSELSVSLLYSPTGLGWDKSCLGHKLSCVAVCEIIDDDSVKCQVKNDESGKKNKKRAYAENSEAGDVPETYYIVQNNDMIRLKYILVYVEKSSVHNRASSSRSWHNTWIYQHRFGLMIVFYVLLLAMVALYNSRLFQYHVRRFWKGR